MKKIVVFIILFSICQIGFGQMKNVQKEIGKILIDKNVTVGVALYDFSTGDTLYVNGDMRFPMMSVFKFHIALKVLSEIDKGKWDLNMEILVEKTDLHENTWSPLRERYPEGNILLPLSEILQYTISQSDNNGCDILLEMVGGADSVNIYMHSKGIKDVNIELSEQDMKRSWEAKFINWTTPKATIELLKLFNNEDLLLPETHNFMWETMANTSTGSIKNRLPENTVVAHKTGASGFNEKGVSIATNDIGIMVLPSGKRVAVAIYITNSTESSEVNYKIIADIAKVIYYNLD